MKLNGVTAVVGANPGEGKDEQPHSIRAADRVARIGAYQVLAHKRLVLADSRPLQLGSRALDILLVLLEHAGSVVSKERLIARVWPNSVVEDINLRVHIAALRKALGDGRDGQRYITTIPLRGYSLVAPVTWQTPADSPKPQAHNLPRRLTPMIGRGNLVDSLVRQVRQKRFVTLVGPGGIGKTTVALHVAERLLEAYPQGVWLLDLAPLDKAAQLPSTLAAALDLTLHGDEPLHELASYLRDRQMLLILDNCEHLIEAVAELAESLLKAAPRIDILATSREVLRAEGEHVQRLGPLACPPSTPDLTRPQALGFPALQLLVERAIANQGRFELTDSELPLAAELCRRLDGIPLAIELAAAQLGALGLAGVLAQLVDRFRLLNRGRRTAPARQRTLRATLDWSHQLLPAHEQASLRRLSVFPASFTLDAAAAVIGPNEAAPLPCLTMSQLVAKSLVSAEAADDQVHYHLLETTRTYALEKLREAAEEPTVRRRHAQYCLALMEQALQEWEVTPTRHWIGRFAPRVDDLRAALDWGFSAPGEEALAILLTASSTPLWQELSLLHEHGRHVARALAALEAGEQPCLTLQVTLTLVLGSAWYHTRGGTPETIEAFVRAGQLAERCHDLAGQLKAASGLMAVNLSRADYAAALEQTRHFDRLCLRDAPELSLSLQRLGGLAQHFAGNQAQARQHAEYALAHIAQQPPAGHFTNGFGVQYDQQVAALSLLARILWLQGYPEQAWHRALQALDVARRIEHGTSLCYTLALSAWVIARYNGHHRASDELLELMLVQTSQLSLNMFHGWAQHYARETRAPGASTLDEPALPGDGMIADIMATLNPSYVDDALLARAQSGQAGWVTAEVLRARATDLLARANPEPHQAESLLREALAIAGQQGALAWELRAACSLARLWRQQGRRHEAQALLEGVYGRFTEGFATPDLLMARRLLDQCSVA
ncbi:Predicted ATPase [Pseudomonas benzenivorans]|nr:winged helix-turn-helix domain-containing protein [Pseudomonas benzenivorans]SDH57337.1 Predicted ATPase [Pseudomonas benzenivorans]